MKEIFQLREEYHCNLGYASKFVIPSIHSVYHGSESATYLGPKILGIDFTCIIIIIIIKNGSQLIDYVGFPNPKYLA